MPRKTLIRSSELVYHVTSRSNNRDWFSLPLGEVWQIFCCGLLPSVERYGTEIHTLCLMSNHFHLLVSTPNKNLDEMMRDFMTAVSKTIARRSGRINHVFGGRYKWSALSTSWSVAFVYKYICRNPIRASLCTQVEEYPYLTIGQLWKERHPLPICERTDALWRQLRMNEKTRLAWLNQPTPNEVEALIGRALRRFEFKFTASNTVRKQWKNLCTSYGVTVPLTDTF